MFPMIQTNKIPGQPPTLTMRPMTISNSPYRISGPPEKGSDPSKINLQLQKHLLLKEAARNIPPKPVVNKAKELRARLKAEIENRAKTCTFTPHKCSLPRVQDFQFCLNHILQDPSAPYKQCSFVYTCNGKRCINAAPKVVYSKHNSYCFEHSRHAQRVRSRTLARWMPQKSLDATLAQLSHYLAPTEGPTPVPIYYPGAERIKREVVKKEINVRTDENGKIVPLDPLIEIDVDAVEKSRNPLNYASESDSDDEPALYGDVNQSLSFLASDDEYVEDNSTDPLKHAGIYTGEEANMIMRDKLTRLQTLYVEQFRLLHQEFKMKKAKLMPSLKREMETLCSVQEQPKESQREYELYKKLKACKRYYKKTGLEAVLQDRSLERRARQMDGQQYKSHSHQTGPKCIFAEGGVKCTDKPVLCSKYCRKHVLEDKRQILFKPCGVELGGVVCREPITGLLEIDTCPLHYKIPEPRAYTIRKDCTDSEHSEEDLSTSPNSPGESYDMDSSTLKDNTHFNIATNEDINIGINEDDNIGINEDININMNEDINIGINEDINTGINEDDNIGINGDDNVSINEDDNIGINDDVNMGINISTNEDNMSIKKEVENDLNMDVNKGDRVKTEVNINEDTNEHLNTDANINIDQNPNVNMDVNMDLDVAECDVVTMDCQEENVQEEIVQEEIVVTEEVTLS